MRILLFNLGSIKERIIAFDLNGYKPIFEHDIILWGPIPDAEFEINNKKVPIISFFETTSIRDVFDKLPSGWFPDIVTCDTSTLNFIPDIHLCPVTTVLFTRDAWADTIFNRRIVELFDFICHSVIDFQVYSNYATRVLPLAGFPVSIPDPDSRIPDFEEREIDVVAIANYNSGFYHNRFRTLYKLAEDNELNLSIKYFKGMQRQEIHELYKRSKIVIDWSHTLSNRSYEAALNGCLLFSHEENVTVSTFWDPWKEYVPYNETNLYKLICHYIQNPSEASEIIATAGRKLKSYPIGFGHYTLDNLIYAHTKASSVQERIERVKRLTPSDLQYCTATPMVYNYRYDTDYPLDWSTHYFERIDLALSSSPDDSSKISPLIEAARVAFLIKEYPLSENYIDQLKKIIPEYAWIYYLEARILCVKGETNQALSMTKKAVECGLSHPHYLARYILPVIEKRNPCDGRRITDYLWQDVYKHTNEYQVRALLYMAYDLAGDIYQVLDQRDAAKETYCKALVNVQLSESVKKIAPLLIKSSEIEELHHITEGSMNDSPYDSIVVLYNAYSKFKLGNSTAARKILKSHQKALESFVGIKRLYLIRQAINIILFLSLLNNKAALKAITKLIEILNERPQDFN